ncbi:uncharacterized protein TNCV_1486381 [Trichonephila clavipes]|nr:uncharacterized protein TNCV_1486381 [Trichonephila clavipes]
MSRKKELSLREALDLLQKLSSEISDVITDDFSDEEVAANNNLLEFSSIGRGRSTADTFCGIMSLPSPLEKFRTYTEMLFNSTQFTCEKSMRNSVEQATRIEGSYDIDVALNDSWQKRGYQSLSGIVTVTSVDTAQVIDFEVFSKHCRYKTAFNSAREPSCIANDSGTSRAMERKSVMTIFERSEDHYGVHYTKYLDDGD